MRTLPLAIAVSAAFLCCSEAAGADFTWLPTTGGDIADGANWNQSGAVPGATKTTDRLLIKKDQSAPITLSKDIDLSRQYNHNFAFNGELKFDTTDTTLTLQRLFFQGNNKTTTFTRGTLNIPTLYFEAGNTSCYDNKFIVDGADAKYIGSTVQVGSKNRDNAFIATNGASVQISSLCVGRDAILNSNGTVASNNLFRVTGAGTTLTASTLLSTGVREGNWIEILDGAQATAPQVKLGVWANDNAAPTTPHLYDGDHGLRLSGAGTKLVVDGGGSSANRLTVGWQSGSNTLEVADGAELRCVTNMFIIGNYVSTLDETANVTNRIPDYRFAGNCVRVTGAGSKITLDSAKGQMGFFMARGGCDDQRLEILNGASWDSRGEFWVQGGVSNGVYIGQDARFNHSFYSVQIGVEGRSTNAYFMVDGGVYAPEAATILGVNGVCGTFDVINGGVYAATNANLTIGSSAGSYNVMTIGTGGRLVTSNAALCVTKGTGEGNVFAVRDGGKASFFLNGGKHNVSAASTSGSGTILVSGAGSELDMATDLLMAAPVAGAHGARLVVEDGGLLRVKTVYWGDQGTNENDCAIIVTNGTIELSGWLNVGGSDHKPAHGCVLSIAGSSPAITGDGVGINRDSTIAFDVPENGYAATPVRVKSFSFGTKCTVARPMLRVTMAPKNAVRRVTLVEAENDITVPGDLRLDLPEGARLLQAGDYGYDAKRLTVRLPRYTGALLIIR